MAYLRSTNSDQLTLILCNQKVYSEYGTVNDDLKSSKYDNNDIYNTMEHDVNNHSNKNSIEYGY